MRMQLLVHVTFTRLYILKHKLNNMDDVNTIFWTFNLWCHHESVRSGRVSILLVICGSGRVTENRPIDISDLILSNGTSPIN